MPTYGLIGYPLSHSFSRGYFTEKFRALGMADTHRYLNFELPSLEGVEKLPARYPDLVGCNVTIPHKRAIVARLDALDPVAARIGAVNTIRFSDGRATGFNTDYVGFRDDLLRGLGAAGRSTDLKGTSALILGTGGASLAVREVLRDLGVTTTYVSRQPAEGVLTYTALDPRTIQNYPLIVNTTPLGMHPAVDAAPAIPYAALTAEHFCYDLIYNPTETRFMREARGAGAGAMNGLGMLHRQAEASWEIWNAE